MQYSRIMGIDYGDKRIGIALTDLLCLTASAYKVVENQEEIKTLEYLANLAKEMQVKKIVLGFPYCLDGQENERTKITKDFGEKLSQFSKIEVIYEDERLSSVEAEEILKEKRISWQERKKVLDMFSAQVILQSYLNHK